MKVTAETITDDQIRHLDPFDISSELRADALGLPCSPYDGRVLTPEDRRHARKCCASAWNACHGDE